MAAFLFSLTWSVSLFMFGINLDLMWLRLSAKPLPILALIIKLGPKLNRLTETRSHWAHFMCHR